MENDDRITFEVIFARLWEARFISHLDLMRGIARGMRRSGLPIYFSEGFNPKPKISYCTQPLSIGHTSQCERIQIHLHGDKFDNVDIDEVREALGGSMMPGLRIMNFRLITPGEKKKGQGDSYEYACFKKPSRSGESARDAGAVDVDVTKVLEKLSWKMESVSTAIDGIVANSDDDGGAGFIKENFETAAIIVIQTGEGWVRPDEAARAIPDFSEPGDTLYLHRKIENVGNV